MAKVCASIVVLSSVLSSSSSAAVSTATGYKGITQIRYANAYCESSGDIHAIGWHGIYRGKWQFDQATWNAFAPSWLRGADPAWVSEYWQDRVALAVTYDAWPRC